MKLLCTFFIFIATLSTLSAYTFTNVDGRTLGAEILSVEKDGVRVRLTNGQTFILPLNTLSAKDQKYISEWKAKAPIQAAPKPPADAKKAAEAEERRVLRVLEELVCPSWHQGFAARWAALPKLRLNSDDPELGKFAEAAFNEVCQITGLKPGPGELTAEIHIGPHEKMKKLVTKEKESINIREGASYYVFWDEKHQVERTLILLSMDKFDKDVCRHYIINYMLQTFGLGDFTKELKPEDGSPLSWDYSGAQTMSPLDRKMLEFLYKHVPCGADRSDLRSLFRKHWQP